MNIESIPGYSEEYVSARSKMYQKARNIVYETLPYSFADKIRSAVHPKVKFGGEPVEIECAGLSAEMYVNNWSDYYIVHENHCEEEILERVINSLRSKAGRGVFWDIGAAQGIYSIFAGQVVEKVVSIEPNVYNIPSLLANLKRNNIGPNISEIISTAIGDEEGRRTIFFDAHNVIETSLVKTKDNLRDRDIVSVSTIDGLLEEGYPVPTDIKIDVEGAEGLVLRGASNLFASANKPHDLFIEFHPSFLPLPKFDTTYEDEYLRVIDSGYSLVAHHKRHGQVLCHFTARI